MQGDPSMLTAFQVKPKTFHYYKWDQVVLSGLWKNPYHVTAIELFPNNALLSTSSAPFQSQTMQCPLLSIIDRIQGQNNPYSHL